MKTFPCNTCIYPLTHNFYIHVVKLGFTGVYIFFLVLLLKRDCGLLTEAVLTSTHNQCFEQKLEK